LSAEKDLYDWHNPEGAMHRRSWTSKDKSLEKLDLIVGLRRRAAVMRMTRERRIQREGSRTGGSGGHGLKKRKP
jgi:hypothetical protein